MTGSHIDFLMINFSFLWLIRLSIFNLIIFNLFCVNDTGIFTPDYGVLEGITRQSVFDLAKELNLPIVKKVITVEELQSANELFASSTAGGIMPITKVSRIQIGNGSVGDITRQLHKLYWEKHTDDNWSTSISDILTN